MRFVNATWAISVVLSALIVLPFAGTADAADPVLEEWKVPWERTRPRDPFAADSGLVWFVGQRADYVASLDPTSGAFKRYELEEGTGPHNLIVDADGMVWYAGNRAAHIGRLDPASGEIEKIPMPNPAAVDPHTLVFDAAGDIWFTVQGGNFVGKLTVKTRVVDLIEVPTRGARPYGIKVAPDGTVWVALFGTHKLARIDPAKMMLEEIELVSEDARPRRLEITSDGIVWYVDYVDGMLGRLDPKTGAIDEWNVPGGSGSRPYGMASDAKDRIWFVETRREPNRLIGFDPRTSSFTSSVEIESGGGTVRHMHYRAATNAVWFGTDTNTIGRAQLP